MGGIKVKLRLVKKICDHRSANVSVCEQTNAVIHKDDARTKMVHIVKDITILPSVLFLTRRGMGRGLRVINGISALVRWRLLWRTPLCWRSFPSPEEGKSTTDLWTCKSADLTVLHGRPHRVTAITVALHCRDPRSTIRSSHYCTVHQNLHINVF